MDIRALTIDITGLRDDCRGGVFRPSDDPYEVTCAGWNLAWTHRPAVVVAATCVDDVAHAVRFAADHDLTVAVQNTGHGVTVPADEGTVLVRVGGLDQVRVDTDARTATVGGGATWSPVLARGQAAGLAPLLGSAPHVGCTGYSLGGGFGWLARKHGLAVDAVRSLTVVLADGSVATATPEVLPDLFWALCGTAASGVAAVVEMEVALVPVTDVYAGNLFYPLDDAVEVFDRYLAWSGQAPVELTSAFNISSFPPLDVIPEPLRGRAFAIVRGCYEDAGATDSGAALVDEWRAWREPIMDNWGTLPFGRSAEISMDPVDPVPAASSGRWLAHADHAVVDAMLEAVVGGVEQSPMLFAETRHAGGATARPNPTVSFEAREGERLLELVGMVTSPESDVELDRRFADTWGRLNAHLAPLSGYLNFAEGQEKIGIFGTAFSSATHERLAAIKHRYDPADRFRHGVPLRTRAT